MENQALDNGAYSSDLTGSGHLHAVGSTKLIR
jgi:hypothetical protein